MIQAYLLLIHHHGYLTLRYFSSKVFKTFKPQESFPTWPLNYSQTKIILSSRTTVKMCFLSASMRYYGIYADTLVSKIHLTRNLITMTFIISLRETFFNQSYSEKYYKIPIKKLETLPFFDKATYFKSATLRKKISLKGIFVGSWWNFPNQLYSSTSLCDHC